MEENKSRGLIPNIDLVGAVCLHKLDNLRSFHAELGEPKYDSWYSLKSRGALVGILRLQCRPTTQTTRPNHLILRPFRLKHGLFKFSAGHFSPFFFNPQRQIERRLIGIGISTAETRHPAQKKWLNIWSAGDNKKTSVNQVHYRAMLACLNEGSHVEIKVSNNDMSWDRNTSFLRNRRRWASPQGSSTVMQKWMFY